MERMLRNKTVLLLLLISLFTNIAHAAIIYSFDSCEHETVCEYVVETQQESECGGICNVHHMFHLSAIPAQSCMFIPYFKDKQIIEYCNKDHFPPINDKTYRPPIS